MDKGENPHKFNYTYNSYSNNPLYIVITIITNKILYSSNNYKINNNLLKLIQYMTQVIQIIILFKAILINLLE